MKIVVFTDEKSYVVNAPDGTLSWKVKNSDDSISEVPVKMYVYRELSVHKFAYIAQFIDVGSDDINNAVIQHGYNV